jgi:hypothetical protein
MRRPDPELLDLLAEHAERVLHELDAVSAAVSCWERDRGVLRTLVNVGDVRTGDEAFPADELYPLDTFPAIDALLRFGRSYVDPPDVASSAVLAHMRFGSQAAVPVIVEGRVWGELWAATEVGGRALGPDDLAALTRAAEAIGRVLADRQEG